MSSPGRARLNGAFLLLTLIWGTTWAAIRLGLGGLPPFTGFALRFLVAGTLLFALAPVFRVRFTWRLREIGLWLLNGALAFSASYSVVYWAEQYQVLKAPGYASYLPARRAARVDPLALLRRE